MSEWSLVRAALIAALIFAASSALGVGAVVQDPTLGEDLMEVFEEEIAGQILDASPFSIAVKIFLNNLSACILLFLGGASFGALTVLILTVNGLLIGSIMELVRQQEGVLFVVAAVAPHGVFEIPSFILAGALGLLLGQALLAEWRGDGDAAATAAHLARYFVRFAVPLLAVAAITEAFITPALLSFIA